MNAHSTYSASAASRWMTCPGSLALAEKTPRTSNPAARRGTLAHAISAECLEDDSLDPMMFLGDVREVEGHEHEFDEDLAQQSMKYVEYVRGFSGVRLVEVRSIYAPVLGLEDDEAWGTADAVVIQDDGTVHVIDLKTGRRWVQAPGNRQLLLYAAGVVASLEAVGIEVKRVVLHIVQPVVHAEPSTWELTREEFKVETDKLRERAKLAEEALFAYSPKLEQAWVDRYLMPDEDACQWCPAAYKCPKLQAVVDEHIPSADVSEFDMANHIEGLDADTLNEAMTALPLIEIWANAINAEMTRRATRGDGGLSHKLVLGRAGNRRWDGADRALEALEGEGVPRDALLTEPELKSPAQLEKTLKKLKRADLIDTMDKFVVRNPARPTLVPKDDPRPQWTEAAIEDDFGVVS